MKTTFGFYSNSTSQFKHQELKLKVKSRLYCIDINANKCRAEERCRNARDEVGRMKAEEILCYNPLICNISNSPQILETNGHLNYLLSILHPSNGLY